MIESFHLFSLLHRTFRNDFFYLEMNTRNIIILDVYFSSTCVSYLFQI